MFKNFRCHILKRNNCSNMFTHFEHYTTLPIVSVILLVYQLKYNKYKIDYLCKFTVIKNFRRHILKGNNYSNMFTHFEHYTIYFEHYTILPIISNNYDLSITIQNTFDGLVVITNLIVFNKI